FTEFGAQRTRRRMATPESKLSGKSAEDSAENAALRADAAEQPASEGGVESAASRPDSGQAESGPYKIHIPMYEGPLDLLLDLIRQQKMSIHDIQISEITAQYRSEEHTSELQSRFDLVCRLLLEKKK